MPESAEKPALIVVTSSFPRAPGGRAGGGGFILDLCAQLAQNYDVHVLHPVTSFSEAHAPGRLRGVTPHPFRENPFGVSLAGAPGLVENVRQAPWKLLFVPLSLASLFFALLRIVRAHPAAKVHAHWIFPAGFVSALVQTMSQLRGVRFPLVVSSHGSDLNVLAHTPARALLRFTLARAAAFSGSNEGHLALARTLGLRAPGCVLHLGVDTDIFSQSEANPALRKKVRGDAQCVFVFTGNLVPPKGIPELLVAFERVNVRHEGSIRIALIGEGDVKSGRDLRSDAARGIHWLGRLAQADVAAVYSCCDAFVFPSHREGFPLSVPEALACGLPAILSPLPYTSYYSALNLPRIASVGDVDAIELALEDFLARKDSYSAKHATYRSFVTERLGWHAVAQAYGELIAEAGPERT